MFFLCLVNKLPCTTSVINGSSSSDGMIEPIVEKIRKTKYINKQGQLIYDEIRNENGIKSMDKEG